VPWPQYTCQVFNSYTPVQFDGVAFAAGAAASAAPQSRPTADTARTAVLIDLMMTPSELDNLAT
jgi:hypothetical protein